MLRRHAGFAEDRWCRAILDSLKGRPISLKEWTLVFFHRFTKESTTVAGCQLAGAV